MRFPSGVTLPVSRQRWEPDCTLTSDLLEVSEVSEAETRMAAQLSDYAVFQDLRNLWVHAFFPSYPVDSLLASCSARFCEISQRPEAGQSLGLILKARDNIEQA